MSARSGADGVKNANAAGKAEIARERNRDPGSDICFSFELVTFRASSAHNRSSWLLLGSISLFTPQNDPLTQAHLTVSFRTAKSKVFAQPGSVRAYLRLDSMRAKDDVFSTI
jgi:hypothetical protein